MDSIKIERLDHHGIVAGIIDELKIVEIIDAQIEADEQESITTGEAIKAMIINGLGFSNRPLMLTPQFFENLPLETLFREGVEAGHFNRYKLGRSLDKVFDYGCDLLFSLVTSFGCQQEQVDRRFNSLDSTSFSVTGEYEPEEDGQAVLITYGHSKDHRPDLKQVVLELLVSQDGGVPFVSQSWDGNGSDNVIFERRAKALVGEFQASETPQFLIADSKLYSEKSASTLAKIPFITRIPGTLKLEQIAIDQALSDPSAWINWDKGYQYQRLDLCHYAMEQRWLVVHSQAALKRATATLDRKQKKEQSCIDKALFHLQAQRFDSKASAEKALVQLTDQWQWHQLTDHSLTQHNRYAQKGRPNAQTPIEAIEWQIHATYEIDQTHLDAQAQHKACFVLGTNINDMVLSNREVFEGYKSQSSVEGGFRFLKDPLFFVSSLFLKKPARIEALLMVMTLALFVYSIAQRRLRANLQAQDQTLPNQIDQPTKRPTLRWVFQLFEGIHFVTFISKIGVKVMIDRLSDLRQKILRLLGPCVCRIYQISPEGG